MTNATVTSPAYTSDHPDTGRATGLAVVLSIAMTIVIILRDTDSGPAWRVGLVLAVAIAIATAVVFGVVVRRTLAKPSPVSAARAGLVLGVLALLSLGVFWMAVTPILGVAAVLLAKDARDRRPFRGEAMATAGGVLGVLAVVGGLVLSGVA
jgi:hypothetical protein